MVQFDISGLDEFMAKLEQLGQSDEIASEMMEAGMDVLEKEVIEEASKHQDTGEMVASIKRTGLQAGYGGGYYMCTRPTGNASGRKGKRKIRNMEKLVYLENGVKGRPATPVITKAVIRAEPQVVRAMWEVFERKVGEL